jgi:hypothetical protein
MSHRKQGSDCGLFQRTNPGNEVRHEYSQHGRFPAIGCLSKQREPCKIVTRKHLQAWSTGGSTRRHKSRTSRSGLAFAGIRGRKSWLMTASDLYSGSARFGCQPGRKFGVVFLSFSLYANAGMAPQIIYAQPLPSMSSAIHCSYLDSLSH